MNGEQKYKNGCKKCLVLYVKIFIQHYIKNIYEYLHLSIMMKLIMRRTALTICNISHRVYHL